MKREIRDVDSARGLICITTQDQRFYGQQISADGINTVWEWAPSVTWISGMYPKNERFIKFVGRVGNEQADEAKEAGGEKGSKVHQAIKVLLHGGTVDCAKSLFPNRHDEPEELNAAEIECIMSFIEWMEITKPEIIACEFTVWSDRYRYAGTVDLYCRINGVPYIVDFKVSPQIYPSHEIQVSAYKFADARFPANTRLAILQLNYRYNKKQKWKFTRVKQQFMLFLAVRKTWQKEFGDVRPYQKDFPLSLSLSPELTLREARSGA